MDPQRLCVLVATHQTFDLSKRRQTTDINRKLTNPELCRRSGRSQVRGVTPSNWSVGAREVESTFSYAVNLIVVSGAIFRTLMLFPLHNDHGPPSFTMVVKLFSTFPLKAEEPWTWHSRDVWHFSNSAM